ncbi:MAG: T9SS type A sorting domain-containing protein, partial [Bacteroidetes bacterium]|nr:T9SS type A sorting domain-containing protein [Bacteroidota bacterium]MCL2301815.1 T9SS type A sorting domain-containing protein [Lentimicrobiaceae bacterium]
DPDPDPFRGDFEFDTASFVRITGLQSLCNIFNNTQSVDILVAGPQHSNCIRRNQGGMRSPAGNRFNGTPILNIDNALSQHYINYYYDENADNALPNNITSNVFPIPIPFSNGCPSKLGTGGIGDLDGALSQYDEWNSTYEYWLAQFLAFEGDNEEEYNALLDMVSHYSALKDNHFNSIIIAMDEEIQSGMRYGVSGNDEAKGNKSPNFEGVDGVAGRGSLNLRTLLLYRGNYTDYLSVIETYLKENNYKEAMVALTKMYERFEITEEEAFELNDLKTYIYWLLQLEETENNIYTLSENEINYLIHYVETHTGRGRAFANIILCELYEVCIEEEEEEGRKGKEEGRKEGEESSIEPVINNILQVYDKTLLDKITVIPNPTTGELRVESGELKIDKIDVFDIVGRTVSSHHLIISSSHHKIDISHLNSGIYFIKTTTNQGDVVKKVVKQ